MCPLPLGQRLFHERESFLKLTEPRQNVGISVLCRTRFIRVAGENAQIAISEVCRGLFPMSASTIRLPRQIPFTVACELLLVGDETAVPAIAAVLSQLPVDACGAAFLEVPVAADVQSVLHPEGVRVEWLPRDGRAVGARLHQAVLEHLGAGAAPVEVPETEVEPGLWETPTYSSSGEDVGEHRETVGHDLADLYAWIAGESRMVTGLRRALVRDLGLDRRQVAFMGYWREGVAMGA